MIKILFASRLVEEKWVDILIASIKMVQKNEGLKNKVTWDICSDGIYTDICASLWEKYKEQVHYHGKVWSTELAKLYRNADFLFMPSRFLETFWLTALESLSSGTPVIGFRKGWISAFIPEELCISQNKPVEDFIKILEKYRDIPIPTALDISYYNLDSWKERLGNIMNGKKKVMIIHDYKDTIGWAEYIVQKIQVALNTMNKSVGFFWYQHKTTSLIRKILFITSPLAFWRGIMLWKMLHNTKPDILWMHSILRYIWPWWLLAINIYGRIYNPRIILAHHDVGLLAAFPQYIEQEDEIPESVSLQDFIPKKLSKFKQFASIGKWLFREHIRLLLPKNTEHMIFSEFLRWKIEKNFPWSPIILFPHSVDQSIFHP